MTDGAATDVAAVAVWQTLARVRARRPLVHNMTNAVAASLVADVLLAAGAAPVMAEAEEEVENVVRAADALAVNLGMPSPVRINAMQRAVEAALAAGVPWVLDPVGVPASAYRRDAALRLAGLRPSAIRGNAAEVMALVGEDVAGGRGVDSAADASEALDAAVHLARSSGAAVAVTGSVDYVTDGHRVAAVANGDPLLTRVSGTGCALTGLVGACLPAAETAMDAAAHALAVFGVAGELAAAEADGPGSLRWRLLDALHGLDETTLIGMASIEACPGDPST